jgi:hypothetical protein
VVLPWGVIRGLLEISANTGGGGLELEGHRRTFQCDLNLPKSDYSGLGWRFALGFMDQHKDWSRSLRVYADGVTFLCDANFPTWGCVVFCLRV